jgi:type III restriction enzyme
VALEYPLERNPICSAEFTHPHVIRRFDKSTENDRLWLWHAYRAVRGRRSERRYSPPFFFISPLVAFQEAPRHAVPDVLAYLQNETELTRSTLVRILKESGRLADFLVNPQRFMDQAASILKYELHRLLVDGIKYDRIGGTGPEAEWEMVLFKNGELVNVLTALQVEKSIYAYVAYDSEIEREFAQKLDQREDIRLFVKLPDWFKVEAPVGTYNPDWAIVKHHDETVYLVRETKGTKDFLELRTAEADKHFEAISVPFAVVTSADDV